MVPAQSKAEENHSLREEDTKCKGYTQSSVLKFSSMQQLICSLLFFIFPGSGILFFRIGNLKCSVCATPDINRKNLRSLFCTQINSFVWRKLGFCFPFPLDDLLYFTSNLAEKWDYYLTQIFFIINWNCCAANTFGRKLYHNKQNKEMKCTDYTGEKCSRPHYENNFLKYELSPRVRNISIVYIQGNSAIYKEQQAVIHI